MDVISYLLIGLAAIAGGAVNALAGGGTLITFPVLMAVGLPAVPANITNTVALCPGYLGGTLPSSATCAAMSATCGFWPRPASWAASPAASCS